MAIRVSKLTPPEIEAADALVELFKKLAAIGVDGRKLVYQRWEMLHLIPDGDGERWEREVKRVTK